MEAAEEGDETAQELAGSLLGEHITYCTEKLNSKKVVCVCVWITHHTLIEYFRT